MAYIDQVKIGSTTYDVHDKRLENPVDFKGVVSTTQYTMGGVAGETDQWKIGANGWVVYQTNLTPSAASFVPYFTTTTTTPATGYVASPVYSGDLVYVYQGTDAWKCEIVPSADNPHTHSIPALSGTAASNGAHTHSVTAAGTLSSAGGHVHTVNVSASVTAGNGHSHTYSVPTQADSAGAHTHNITLTVDNTGVYSGGIKSVAWDNTGSASFTGENHSHSVTAAGTLGSSGSHTHTFNGTAGNTGYQTSTGTVSDAGGHSHTFTGSAVNSGSAGGHSHGINVSKTAITGSAVSGTVLDLSAVLVNVSATADSAGSHSHSVTAAGTLDSKGTHSHTVTMASHRHSFTPTGTLSDAGSHSHTFTGSAVNTGNAKQGGSVSVTWPTYYATLSQLGGSAASAGGHTHALSGSSTKGTSTASIGISVTATLDSAGAHTHTFNGSSVNTNEKGGHTHSVTTTANTTGTGS